MSDGNVSLGDRREMDIHAGGIMRVAVSSRIASACWLWAVGCGPWVVGPLAAQSTDYQPHGFISTRYDAHTSSNIFIGYQIGKFLPMGALVSNPRTTYRDHLLGLAHFGSISPSVGLTWAVAGAKAIDSWYGQLYVLPSITVGRLTYDAQFELYVPLQTQGRSEEH